jgi:hypothetical protein
MRFRLRQAWLLFPWLGLTAQAQDASPVAGKSPKQQVEKVDLNQIDFEQVEEDWDSNPKQPTVDVNRSVRLKDIIEPSSDYSYASFGRPDPFMQPDWLLSPEVPAVNQPVPTALDANGKEIPITSPLQGFPLADLVVKGLWQLGSGEKRAVVLTPKGEGVVVKVGDPISSGKLMQIGRDKLVVRLYRLRSDGVREFEDVDLPVGNTKKTAKGVIRLEPGKEPQFLIPEDQKNVRGNPMMPLGVPMVPAAGMGPGAPVVGGGPPPMPMPAGQNAPGMQQPGTQEVAPMGGPPAMPQPTVPVADPQSGSGRPGAAQPRP